MIIWLSHEKVSEIPVWSLRLMMSRIKKRYLLLVVTKLVEASDCQHLPKVHVSPYVLSIYHVFIRFGILSQS